MRSSARNALTFGGVLTALSVLYFVAMYGMSRPRTESVALPDTLVLTHTRSALASDPGAELWQSVEPTRVRLLPQAARPPFGTEERDVWFRGVFNDREIAVRLDFDDATESRAGGRPPDGCAVMIAPGDAPPTAQMMGHGGGANIWHWTAPADSAAPDSVRVLLAKGPGTQAALERSTVAGASRYADGTWSVVFTRALGSGQEGELELGRSLAAGVALAVWDGARMESLASKSISVLQPLRLEGR